LKVAAIHQLIFGVSDGVVSVVRLGVRLVFRVCLLEGHRAIVWLDTEGLAIHGRIRLLYILREANRFAMSSQAHFIMAMAFIAVELLLIHGIRLA
jgi:hypothetical protein